jgi:twitching motility protein PilT
LITNHAINNLIREDKVHQIYSQMQLGQGDTGMQTQTQALLKFIKDGKISREMALQYANKKDELSKATQAY